eukprot:jgi/Bigna1/140778/aug1.58_g15486
MPMMLAGLLTPTFDPSSIAPWDLVGFDAERAIDALEVLEHVDHLKNKKRRKPKPRSHANRLDWIKRIDRLSPMAFRRRHRMPLELFHKTCDDTLALDPGQRSMNGIQAAKIASPQTFIVNDAQVTSRRIVPRHSWTADLHGVAERSVHHNFWRTLDATNECCKIGFDPSNETQVDKKLKLGLEASA